MKIVYIGPVEVPWSKLLRFTVKFPKSPFEYTERDTSPNLFSPLTAHRGALSHVVDLCVCQCLDLFSSPL